MTSSAPRLLAVCLALACLPPRDARAAANVFDLPSLQTRHLRLLALMDAAHSSSNFVAMEAASRAGVTLGSSDDLWHYNLACALALQGRPEDALSALSRATDLGFADAEHAALDPDLAALRDSETFKGLLARMRSRPPDAAAEGRPPLRAATPDAAGAVLQSVTNTFWSFQLGLFQSLVETAPANGRYRGPEAETLADWLSRGEAAGCAGLLYANRDNATLPFDTAAYPGLLRLAYAADVTERRLQLGLPNTLFIDAATSTLIPAIGHSSMGYMDSPYWRSQPRAVCCDPRQATLQAALLLGNQLHFYPAFGDYDDAVGDLFPANTPYSIAVAGGLNAEQPFLGAAFAALAALRPETRDALARSGLLMPALQMLFRASQRTVRSPADYLTGVAHPPAFRSENLDTARLVRMAHALATNDLPPLVSLAVTDATETVPDRDYFDIARTERLLDTPLAVARIFRGVQHSRSFHLRAYCRRPDARLHWVLLQGDPTRVTFSPSPTNSAQMTLTVAHHEPFLTDAGGGRRIQTSRVDVGVIAETAAGFSAPALFSVHFLANERRTYAAGGRLASVDYTRPTGAYTDPLLSLPRNWKDTYAYDAQGNLTGWTRRRGLAEERFTAFGHKVVATDALGRATRAHIVRYLSRRLKDNDADPGMPDLAQADDNREVTYRYRSDDDRVGTPDLDAVTQMLAPPEDEP